MPCNNHTFTLDYTLTLYKRRTFYFFSRKYSVYEWSECKCCWAVREGECPWCPKREGKMSKRGGVQGEKCLTLGCLDPCQLPSRVDSQDLCSKCYSCFSLVVGKTKDFATNMPSNHAVIDVVTVLHAVFLWRCCLKMHTDVMSLVSNTGKMCLGPRHTQAISDARITVQKVSGCVDEDSEYVPAVLCTLHQA